MNPLHASPRKLSPATLTPCHAHPCCHACPLCHAHPSTMHAPTTHIPLWTEFLTHACENITFPQLRWRPVTRKQEMYLPHSPCRWRHSTSGPRTPAGRGSGWAGETRGFPPGRCVWFRSWCTSQSKPLRPPDTRCTTMNVPCPPGKTRLQCKHRFRGGSRTGCQTQRTECNYYLSIVFLKTAWKWKKLNWVLAPIIGTTPPLFGSARLHWHPSLTQISPCSMSP